MCSTRSISEVTYNVGVVRGLKAISATGSSRSVVHVAGGVDNRGQLTDADFKAVLDLLQRLAILISAHESDGEALGAETTGTSDTVEVGVGVLGHVVVEDNVDSLNVHATSEEVGGHQDSLLEILELLISGESLLLAHPPVYGDGREVLFYQQLRQSDTSLDRLHEDDDLHTTAVRNVDESEVSNSPG